MIDAVLWSIGLATSIAVVSVVLWALLSTLANVFDATWFTTRAVLEGATTNRSVKNVWAIWRASFLDQIASFRAEDGYWIDYPGYGKPRFEDDESA